MYLESVYVLRFILCIWRFLVFLRRYIINFFERKREIKRFEIFRFRVSLVFIVSIGVVY